MVKKKTITKTCREHYTYIHSKSEKIAEFTFHPRKVDRKNLQSLEDTQVGYTSQKYTLENTLWKNTPWKNICIYF